jgi:predicted dehydrogenase
VIGTGDEGNVLIGGCNPKYVQVQAIADIRPFSIHRAFHGDISSPAALAARPGLISQYGYKSEAEAKKNVKVYDSKNGGIQALLDDKDIEAVIIALPLHLHAPIAVQAMRAGKHVLTEKLMAHNVAQCKVMGRVAREEGLHLATGHQRHYSVLYDNAVHLIQWGLLGQLHHIRAQWHRGNLPDGDSWKPLLPGEEIIVNGKKRDQIKYAIKSFTNRVNNESDPIERAKLEQQLAYFIAQEADGAIDAKKFGYVDKVIGNNYVRSAMEELIRWRLWDRTGAGLMGELGSHQLDAASIFCSAMRNDGKKARPISVTAIGGRHIFPMDRECDDHVYCNYEFPGPEYDSNFDVGYYDETLNYPPEGEGLPSYETDPNKKIVVSYSSINGNGFGGYGEVVMGTKGTLVLEKEKDVMLYQDADTSSKVGVKGNDGGYTFDTQASGGYAAPTAAAATGPAVSRGYTEEIEHWAYCIRNPAPENKPKCHPEVAMADAIIAHTTNVAMRRHDRGDNNTIMFQDSWFDMNNPECPDGSSVAEEDRELNNYKVV